MQNLKLITQKLVNIIQIRTHRKSIQKRINSRKANTQTQQDVIFPSFRIQIQFFNTYLPTAFLHKLKNRNQTNSK